MEEGFEVIFCVLPMSSVGCPDVSDLGGGLGQAPQDGYAHHRDKGTPWAETPFWTWRSW